MMISQVVNIPGSQASLPAILVSLIRLDAAKARRNFFALIPGLARAF